VVLIGCLSHLFDCSKSTLVSFCLRFYDPIRGALLIDGVDMKDLNVHAARQQIGK